VGRRTDVLTLARPVARLAVPVLFEQAGIVLFCAVNTLLASNGGCEPISAVGTIDSIGNLEISVFGALSTGRIVAIEAPAIDR